MSSPRGLVTDTIEFSSVDGPGNRFVVFLQGCTFDCLACHNPYTINPCIDCHECIETCPSGALGADAFGHMTWDADVCTGGDTCLAVCPYDASPKARSLEVADVLAAVRPAAPFLSGITVSGGEATMQPGFLRALFTAVREDPTLARLTCFIDSNGDAPRSTWDQLEPVTDGVMLDLKSLDPGIHRQLTGMPNDRVLRSIEHLHGIGLLHEVRLLIIPGRNDADDLLAATGRWLADVDPRMRLRVIGYRPHGVRPGPLPVVEATREQREHFAAVVGAEGDFRITVV